MKKTLTALGAIALGATTAMADPDANRETAIAAMNDVFVGLDASLIDTYFAEPYIQHNQVAESGLDALRGLVAHAQEGPGFGLETVRIIAEGDMVVMHNVWEGFGPGPMVAFDVFRFDDSGRIVEHWDNLQPLSEAPNPSGRTQIDGETEIIDLDQTAANRALIEDFITRALINGEQVDFTDYINPDMYLQHNTQAGDGLEGLGAFLGYLAENDIAFYYTDVAMIVAEGNFVFAASEGVFGDQATAYFDLFRLENGRIVEHWDVIADMPEGELPDGYPGKF